MNHTKKDLPLSLRSAEIFELAEKRFLRFPVIERSNKPFIGPMLDWFRVKLIKRHLMALLHDQNDFNDKAYQLLKNLNNEVILLQLERFANHLVVDKEFFDQAYYEGGRKSTYIDYALHEGVFMELAQVLLSFFKPTRVLDAGCAYGFLPKAFRALGIEAEGIDFSEFAVKKANVDYVKVGDITALPYPDHSFDLVVCSEVLEHLNENEVQKSLAELIRVSSRNIFLTIAVHEAERSLDISHINIHSRDYWEGLLETYPVTKDCEIVKLLDEHPFSAKTGWEGHYFVLKVQD